jgi:hypothetical protein
MNLITLLSTVLAAPLAAGAFSLPTPAPAPADPPADAGRPVLRVSDVTSQGSARHDRLDQAWTDCLIEAGAPTVSADSEPRPVPSQAFSKDTGLILDWPAPAAAREACASVEPVYPPILKAATNPDFAAMAQTYVSCLEAGDLHVRLLNDDDLDWTYRAAYDVPADSTQTEDSCLLGTFGQG